MLPDRKDEELFEAGKRRVSLTIPRKQVCVVLCQQ